MDSIQDEELKNYYVLSPVCAQAYIKKNQSELPLLSSDTPRIVCDLNLDEVPLSLVDVSIHYYCLYVMPIYLFIKLMFFVLLLVFVRNPVFLFRNIFFNFYL